MHIAPGDPATIIGGPTATASDLAAIREDLGLNEPVLVQYVDYMKNLFQGDMGYSYQTGQPVTEAIISRLPTTVKLASASMLIAIVIGIPVGMLSAVKHNSWLDRLGTTFTLFGVSIPNFWLGTMLILIFSVTLGWLPVSGLDQPFYTNEGFRQLILPAITLGTSSAALIARITRSSMLEVTKQDYIRTAKAKGVEKRPILWIHALRNAMIPVLTVIGISFGSLLSGTIVTERVFAINGIGRLMIDAISSRDLPMVQGTVLLVAAIFVVVNLVVDLVYVQIDPRVSYE
jgi:peptide/nickel transport system permease protein